jgi:hypothetical protein
MVELYDDGFIVHTVHPSGLRSSSLSVSDGLGTAYELAGGGVFQATPLDAEREPAFHQFTAFRPAVSEDASCLRVLSKGVVEFDLRG